jgi:hypothetical protein
MAKVLVKCGVKRQSGYLYYLDKKGNVARVPMARGGKKGKGKTETLVKCGVKRQAGYLYFIDKAGNVAMTEMARGRKKKRK